MTRFLIYRPISVFMSFLGLLIFSIVAFRSIPVSPLPDVDIPEISVHVYEENVPALELERTVVTALRMQLGQVPNVEQIHSESNKGHARIDIKFRYGSDINYAFLETNERVDMSMALFPRGMDRPRVIKASISDIPVFDIDVRYKDPQKGTDIDMQFSLNEFVNQVVKRRLEQLPEIALVDITGVREPVISIVPRPAILSSLGIREDFLPAMFEKNEMNLSSIRVNDGLLEYDLNFYGDSIRDLDDIRGMSFKLGEKVIHLADIADIRLDEKRATGKFISDGMDAVNLKIIKQPDAKMSALLENSAKILSRFEEEYPDIVFRRTRDETALLDFSISNLKQDLLSGSLLAFFMLFLFLKNWKTPLLIAIVVPVALFISLAIFYLAKLSINIISLSGLVLGVGLMIDNSIIIIDSITQRTATEPVGDACSTGVRDVIRPLICSALTTTSVFLPLIFLNGIAGALFYDEAMAVTIGLFVSLLVAITLLPALYFAFHKNDRPGRAGYGIPFFERIDIPGRIRNLYGSTFDLVFQHRKFLLPVIPVLLVGAIAALRHMKNEQLPSFNTNELVVRVDWNRNISIRESERRVRLFMNENGKYIRNADVFLGMQQFILSREVDQSVSECSIYMEARDHEAVEMIKRRLSARFKNDYADAVIEMSKPKTIFEKVFGNDDYDLIAHIGNSSKGSVPDDSCIVRLMRRVQTGFPDVQMKNVPVESSRLLKMNAEKLLSSGITPDMIYNKLNYVLNANNTAAVDRSRYRYSLSVSGQQDHTLDELVASSFIRNMNNVDIPLRTLVDTGFETSYKIVEGDEKGFYIPLKFRHAPILLKDSIERWVGQDRKLEVGFSGLAFSGEALKRSLLAVLGVTILLLYFILAAQFESLLLPLIVLIELPVSIAASVLILFACGQTLNLMSMIGLIVMCGIIINDSILKIDTINHLYRREGFSLLEAIHEGGLRRINSIVMTALTTVLSVVPFLFGSDMGAVMQQPLSIALIGGIVIGTFVSVYFVPVLYWYCFKNSNH